MSKNKKKYMVVINASDKKSVQCIPPVLDKKTKDAIAGVVEGDKFWFDKPLVFVDGSQLAYWPL